MTETIYLVRIANADIQGVRIANPNERDILIKLMSMVSIVMAGLTVTCHLL